MYFIRKDPAAWTLCYFCGEYSLHRSLTSHTDFSCYLFSVSCPNGGGMVGEEHRCLQSVCALHSKVSKQQRLLIREAWHWEVLLLLTVVLPGHPACSIFV